MLTTDKPGHPAHTPGTSHGLTIESPVLGDAFDKRVYWRSRRGMTELEAQLLPFAVAQYPHLEQADKQLYAQLLEHEDWEIFDWLQGRETVADPQLRHLVARIIAFSNR